MKVYGWTSFYPSTFTDRTKNCRCFVAARSQADAARILSEVTGYEMKPRHLQNLSDSGNEHEIQVASAEPGVVFFWDQLNHAPADRVAVRLADWIRS